MLKKNQVELVKRLNISEEKAIKIMELYVIGTSYMEIASKVEESLDDVNYVIRNWNTPSETIEDKIKRDLFLLDRMYEMTQLIKC